MTTSIVRRLATWGVSFLFHIGLSGFCSTQVPVVKEIEVIRPDSC